MIVIPFTWNMSVSFGFQMNVTFFGFNSLSIATSVMWPLPVAASDPYRITV